MNGNKQLLGASLIQANLISEDQLEEALKIQRKTGHSLGFTLIKKGFVDPHKMIHFFESQLGISYANLGNYVIDPAIVKMIPKNIAIQYYIIPLLKVKNTLTVAMLDPLDSFVLDILKDTTGCDIKPLISSENEIVKAINLYYGGGLKQSLQDKASEQDATAKLRKISGQMQNESSATLKKLEQETLKQGEYKGQKKSPVIELVDLIINQAINDKVSDIHIEPDDAILRVRYRMDGILTEVMSLSKQLESTVASRIKIMAELDIAEKRVPQDGRINLMFQGREIDLRVSTFPTILGEKVVLRILDRSNTRVSLESLGFASDLLTTFSKLIKSPNGIILVTGPTGSGKSTTLYACLEQINNMESNIVTVEDPVEYQLPIINQSQVNPKAGYTFPKGLRSILRQDPDIIMIGEIRDFETAEIAIRAALTGHLVFSTLHTNDAAGAFTRLLDMGMEPFLVASSVICVMGQRLVRLTCPKCAYQYQPQKHFYEDIVATLHMEGVGYEDFTLTRGKGCAFCKKTGFKGRTCINELVVPTDEIKRLVIDKRSSSEIKNVACRNGMRTLKEDGFLKVIDGHSTIEEILRVAY